MELVFGQLEDAKSFPMPRTIGTGKQAITAERQWATQTGIMVNQTIVAVMRIAY